MYYCCIIASELHKAEVLKKYLCIALYDNSHESTFKSFEALLHDNNYILTLDFVIKMLKIHERRECKVPVVIEGETGVGKTALIEMLSQLWNLSWMQGLKEYQKEIGQVILEGEQIMCHSLYCKAWFYIIIMYSSV